MRKAPTRCLQVPFVIVNVSVDVVVDDSFTFSFTSMDAPLRMNLWDGTMAGSP